MQMRVFNPLSAQFLGMGKHLNVHSIRLMDTIILTKAFQFSFFRIRSLKESATKIFFSWRRCLQTDQEHVSGSERGDTQKNNEQTNRERMNTALRNLH